MPELLQPDHWLEESIKTVKKKVLINLLGILLSSLVKQMMYIDIQKLKQVIALLVYKISSVLFQCYLCDF